MEEKLNLTKFIKEEALNVGFSKVGIVPAEELVDENVRLKRWLDRNYFGMMNWMKHSKMKRINPKRVFKNVKSIVSVAQNYYTPVEYQESKEIAKIARYALGEDYHRVMKEKLKLLYISIKNYFPDINGKCFCDTGPLMEKAIAVRAGIGWRGKNSLVITPEFGSWIFLGEILLDIELDFDTPVKEQCGKCEKCIEACPAQAIVEPYILDATKCTSYWTIEISEEIPPETLKKFNNWIYGCDICQVVCPWNRFSKPTTETAFFPKEWNINPPLSELIEMGDDEFYERYRLSSIYRTSAHNIRKNAKAIKDFVNDNN
jgi:epoxyqueuosine reductase